MFPPPVEKYVSELMAEVKAKNPAEPEFHQAVQEVAESLTLVLDREPDYRESENPRADHRAGARDHVSGRRGRTTKASCT